MRRGNSVESSTVPSCDIKPRVGLPVLGPAIALLVALDVAPHAEARRVRLRVRVTKLRQRNSKLGRPSE